MKTTNFFTQLAEKLGEGETATLLLSKKGEVLTVDYTAQFDGTERSINISGTAADFDADFFTEVDKPLEIAKGLRSNVQQVAEEIVADEEAETKTTAKKAAVKKKATAKKAAPAEVKKEVIEKVPVIDEKKKAEQEAKAAEAAKKEKLKTILAEIPLLKEERKHVEVRDKWKEALALYPEDENLKKQLEIAEKWVTALANLQNLEKEAEGGNDGAAS